MTQENLSRSRVNYLFAAARRTRILVIGDVMLDQFIWGSVSRISPEAPVPVVDFKSESFMPGGAANVARNLSALGAAPELFAIVGRDDSAGRLRELLREQHVGCDGLVTHASRPTSIKTRIVAHQQQVVRVITAGGPLFFPPLRLAQGAGRLPPSRPGTQDPRPQGQPQSSTGGTRQAPARQAPLDRSPS